MTDTPESAERRREDLHDAMMCAFNEAADGLDVWEFGGAETQYEYDLHRAAALEVAKRIRRMANRYDTQWHRAPK